jgi:hypothetical protein
MLALTYLPASTCVSLSFTVSAPLAYVLLVAVMERPLALKKPFEELYDQSGERSVYACHKTCGDYFTTRPGYIEHTSEQIYALTVA